MGQRVAQNFLGRFGCQIAKKVLPNLGGVGVAVGFGKGAVPFQHGTGQSLQLFLGDVDLLDRSHNPGRAFGNALLRFGGIQIEGKVLLKLVGVKPVFFDKSLIPRHHVGDKGFDLLGCDRQTALLKQRFEPCRQVGFGRIAFKIGQEILAQAGKIGSRVLRRIVVVAGKQRIDKRFYLFVCGVEFKRSDQRVPVKV